MGTKFSVARRSADGQHCRFMPGPAVKVRPPYCEPQVENLQAASAVSNLDQSCAGSQESNLDWLLRASRQQLSRAAAAFEPDGPIFGPVLSLFGSTATQEGIIDVRRTHEDNFVDAHSLHPEQLATEYSKRQGTEQYQLAVAIALRGPMFMRSILDALGPEEKNNLWNPLVQILGARDRIGRGSEVSGPGPSQFLTGKNLAVVIGPEKPGTGSLLHANAMRFQRAHPQGSVMLVRHTDLASDSLRDVDGVLVVTHGAPGKVGWSGKAGDKGAKLREIDGGELAQILLSAGLPLNTPVQFDSCNAGTDRDSDRPGNSVAANFAAVSQGHVLAARADDGMKQYPIAGRPYLETIPTTGPRLVTPKDFGAFVVPSDAKLGSKTLRGLAIIYPTMNGVDLARLFPGAKLMISAPGAQESGGNVASDIGVRDSEPVHPDKQPMTTWVPGGDFVIVDSSGAMTRYEESSPAE